MGLRDLIGTIVFDLSIETIENGTRHEDSKAMGAYHRPCRIGSVNWRVHGPIITIQNVVSPIRSSRYA